MKEKQKTLLEPNLGNTSEELVKTFIHKPKYLLKQMSNSSF